MVPTIDFIKKLTKEAGLKMLTEKDYEVHDKGGGQNFVTDVDIEINDFIIAEIENLKINSQILSEESEPLGSENNIKYVENLWIIDPIDGTHNFKYKRKKSCVAIAFGQKGELVMSCAYNPFLDELYWAEKGKGAFLNGEKLQVQETSDLDNATVTTDPGYSDGLMRKRLNYLLKLSPLPWILIGGSAVLSICDIAYGRSDCYFHFELNPWDIATPMLILKEAGGVVLDFEGRETSFMEGNVVCGNEKLVRKVIEQINS